jgi:HEAT repeat protein
MPLFKKSKVEQLVKAGDVAGLIALLTGSDHARERADAAHELPRFAEEIEAQYRDAAHAAVTRAAQDADAEVRSSALFALSELRWDDAVEHLMAGAKDSEWVVRMFAGTMLGCFPDERVAHFLGTVLADDREGMVREAVASALGDLGVPGGLESLRRAAHEDPDREVRKAAESALRRLEN